MRRCNLSDAGRVLAYYGDATFNYLGANGQVVVEIPPCYYKNTKVGSVFTFNPYGYQIPGFKIHPGLVSDGVVKRLFVGAFKASVYDVTAVNTEVNTITVTGEPTADGNVTIALDGNYAFTVAIADADTIEGVVDKVVSAGAKTDYQGIVWTPTKVDTDKIRYTAGSTGLKTTATWSAGTTGCTASVAKTTSGAGGYVLNDSAGVDFTATSGDKLCSVAGVKPLSGWNNATATKPNMRVLANNRGTGWGLLNFNQASLIELLYLVEYANFNWQSQIGAGVTAITDATAGTSYNNAVNNGFTAGVGSGATDFGNRTGACTGCTHYKTGEAANSTTFRGLEGIGQNIYEWIDGINIKADNMVWIADHDYVDDTFAHPYSDTGLTLHNANGYPTNIAFGAALDYGFLASAVGGSDATYLCDYYYQATGNRAALLGGHWYFGAYAGPFGWALNDAASRVDRRIGARLSFIG
jgi:hypothetical protein